MTERTVEEIARQIANTYGVGWATSRLYADVFAALRTERERAEKAEADLRIANRGGIDILYAIRASIGWTDKHSLSLLPHECARLKNLAAQWPDEASPVREQIFGAIRAFTCATTSEADAASRAIVKIVRNSAPKGVRWPPKEYDRDGGFDGPTGAD